MNTNNLVAEVTAIISKEAPVDAGQLVQSVPENAKAVFIGNSRKTPTFKETLDQLNDEWYVKHRGIAYNFGAVGINVIGEDE